MALTPRRGLFGGRAVAMQNDPKALLEMLGAASNTQGQGADLGSLLGASENVRAPVISTGAKVAGPSGSQGPQPQPGEPERESIWSRIRTGIRDAGRAYQGLPTSEDEQFGADFAGLLGQGGDPKTREAAYAQMQAAIARRAGGGGDVAPFAQMADSFRQRGMVDDAARTLPGQLQPYGRLAPQAGAGFAFDQNANDIYGGPDGAYFRGAKGSGPMERLQGPQPGYGWQDNPQGGAMPTPGGPNDPAYQEKLQFGRTRGQVEATPPEPVRPIDPPGMTEIDAMLAQKAMRGEPLTPEEQRRWDFINSRSEPMDPFAMFDGMGGGSPQPAPQPSAPRDPAPNVPEGAVINQGGRRFMKRGGQMVPVN